MKATGEKSLRLFLASAVTSIVIISLPNMSYTEQLRYDGKTIWGYPVVVNEDLVSRVQKIGKDIVDKLPSATKERHDWSFYVVDSGKPNAWGGGGGVAVDYRYVQKLSDDELGFVIAHEIAHSVLEHGMPDIKPDIKPKIIAPYVEKLVEPLIEPIEKRLSREQEKNADSFAITFMTIAGYNPEGALSFFEKEMKEEGKIQRTIRRVFWFLETHPLKAERLNTLRKRLGLPSYERTITKAVKEEIIPIALDLGLHLVGIKVPIFELFWPKTALAPTTDQLSHRTAQEQLTPVNVTFTQTYSGTMSQTIGRYGSRTTPFEGSFTGTRVTGDLPGNANFTGTFTGTNVYDPGIYANPLYRNIPFNATMTGQVKGFKEGDLTGTVNVTIVDGLVPTGNTFTYSGDATVKSDGTLSIPSLTGPNYQHRGIPGITPGYVGTSTINHSQTPQ